MFYVGWEIRKILSQYAGGILLPPVQKLVATLIFAKGENANESPQVLSTTSEAFLFAQRKCKRISSSPLVLTISSSESLAFASKWHYNIGIPEERQGFLWKT